MPLSIANLVRDLPDDDRRLPEELFRLIEEGEVDHIGTGTSRKGTITYMAYDIYDTITKHPVMKCIFSTIAGSEGRVVADMDLVINSGERPILFKEYLEEVEDVNENWRISGERQNRDACIQTVNRYIIHDDIKGRQLPVSLSAFPFEVVTGKDIEEVNARMGFDSERFGNENGQLVGLAKDYMSISEPAVRSGEDNFTIMVGQVMDLRKVSLQLGGIIEEALIVDVLTALGLIPTYLTEEYADRIEKGHYIAMYADIKADLSCGSNSYYLKAQYA